MAYAAETSVNFDRSISEVITLLRKVGAQQIGQVEDVGLYAIQFTLADRMIRFRLPLVTEYTGPKRSRNGRAIDPQNVIDQARRQRGRALLLVITAKLESVESGIETIEQAFLAHVVLSDGRTVYERAQEVIAIEYSTGRPSAVAGLLGGPE
ncbi:MAG: hypothetical protein KGL44_05460 [Sphingomonadales bacterium]|nr:hypothetical protein [Sphingomonadales bacterium]